MLKTGHLFAGSGGGLLADLILGHDPIEAVEWNERNCNDLRAKSPEWFPNLRVQCADMREFDGTDWQGRVDILHAGVPCPRWSTARRGQGETYDGWPDTYLKSLCGIKIINRCLVHKHQRVTICLCTSLQPI